MALFNCKRFTAVPQGVDLTTIDRESKYRNFHGWQEKVILAALTVFSVFQLTASITGMVPQQILRYVHLSFAISLAFIMYPTTKNSDRNKMNPIDLIFAGTFISVITYFLINFKPLQLRAGAYTSLDVIMAGLGVLLVLIACWRVVGPPIVIIASTFMLYGLVGQKGQIVATMPGFLNHRGYALSRVFTHLFITTEGVIGNPIGVCSTFMFLFIMFGACLEKTGISQFFIDLANAAAGWAVGGPAKVAVLSSALQGTISGSSVANTVSTGSFTIPLMKSLGYEPEFAGAVESAASTGADNAACNGFGSIPHCRFGRHTVFKAHGNGNNTRSAIFFGNMDNGRFRSEKKGTQGYAQRNSASFQASCSRKRALDTSIGCNNLFYADGLYHHAFCTLGHLHFLPDTVSEKRHPRSC